MATGEVDRVDCGGQKLQLERCLTILVQSQLGLFFSRLYSTRLYSTGPRT
jgi:hypothetical protein